MDFGVYERLCRTHIVAGGRVCLLWQMVNKASHSFWIASIRFTIHYSKQTGEYANENVDTCSSLDVRFWYLAYIMSKPLVRFTLPVMFSFNYTQAPSYFALVLF